MGFVVPLFAFRSIWSDELPLPVLLKGAGLGLLLSTGVVLFVNYVEANILYVYTVLGVIAASLVTDIAMKELCLFAITHPREDAAVSAIQFRLESVRAMQIQPILESDVLPTHMCNPETLTGIRDPDVIGLIRRNYYVFSYLEGYLKNEMKGCLRLIQLKPVGEIAVSSTMFRVLVNAINVSKVTKDIDATIHYFDRIPIKRMLMEEQKKLFRSMKEYVEERITVQKFNSLQTLHGLLQEIAEEYD
jgi:hypothetical protein